jgi:hypothetical protein
MAHGFYFFDDTATVVIAVGAGTINLALGNNMISADCDDWTQHNTKSI